jgi:hypothetical protein
MLWHQYSLENDTGQARLLCRKHLRNSGRRDGAIVGRLPSLGSPTISPWRSRGTFRESLHLLKDHACLLDDLHPCSGWRDRDLAAVEDLHAELGLNFLELHAEGRLGEKTLGGCRRKMVPSVHCDNTFELYASHRPIKSIP